MMKVVSRKGEFELRNNGMFWSVVRPAREGELTNYVVCVGQEKYVKSQWNKMPQDGVTRYANEYIPPACR